MALFRNATDRLFLRFCRTGDARALGQVFDRTAPELLRVACYLCGNRTDAEDLVQRTFLAAIETRSAYDPQRRAVPWLLGILANHKKRLQRERQRPAAAPVEEPTVDPALVAAQRELETTLTQLRADLGEPYREVLRLHLEQGLSAKEIAAQLARPAGTVRTQLVRALEQLRLRLPNGFVAAMVPWLPRPAGDAAAVGLNAVRSAVLHAAHRLGTPATTAAGATSLATVALTGGYLMSKKVLFLAPALLAALGVTSYLAWNAQPELPQAPSAGSPLADAVQLERAPATSAADAAPAALRTAVGSPTAASVAVDPGFAAVRVLVRWAADQTPAASVGVFATTAHSTQTRDAVTGEDGTCVLLHLAPGEWSISSALTESGQSVTLAADELRTLELRAERLGEANGRVVDAMDRPVEDARIWVSLDGNPLHGHEVARSDRQGRFTVPLRSAHYLGARKDGYAPSHTLVADSGKAPSLQPLLRLQHLGGAVRGTVRDQRGTAIAWAQVLVGFETGHLLNSMTAPTHEHLPRGIEVVTDAAGNYEARGVPAGLCEVRAWAPGFAPISTGTEVPANGFAELLITLLPGATVRGNVRDDRGAALAGARVQWGGESDFARGSVISAADGSFALPDLPEGWHELRAGLAGATARTRLQLTAGTIAVWDPVLGTNRPIAGKVVGPRGEPLANFQVSAWSGDTEKAAGATDEAGHFELAEVGAEPVALEVSRSFQSLKMVPVVQPGTTDVVLQLSTAELPTATLRGRIVDPAGRPVPATVVPWREGANRAMHYKTDPVTGAFAVGPVPPGRYTLSFESASHGRQAGGTHELQPDETRDLGDLVMLTPGSAELQITLDGRRAPGGLVFFQLADGSWSDTATIENGIARAPAIRPGRHFVSVDFQGFYAACELVVESGVTTHGNLELQRTGRIEVILKLPSQPKGAQLDATLRASRPEGAYAGVFAIANMDGPPTFLVDLPPGPYHFAIAAADGRKAEPLVVEVPGPRQTKKVEVDLLMPPK